MFPPHAAAAANRAENAVGTTLPLGLPPLLLPLPLRSRHRLWKPLRRFFLSESSAKLLLSESSTKLLLTESSAKSVRKRSSCHSFRSLFPSFVRVFRT